MAISSLQAVLTGDLIGSRKHGADDVNTCMMALASASKALQARYGFDPRFTRNRGDGWQILLPHPKYSLIAMLGLTASLRAAEAQLDTRIGIGIGTVTYPGSRDLSDAAGTALEEAGQVLDWLTENRGYEKVMIGGAGIDKWQQAVITMADWIAQGWTATQAEAVAMVLLDDAHQTNESRAQALGITRQAFEARLKGAGFAALDTAKGAFWSHDFEAPPDD